MHPLKFLFSASVAMLSTLSFAQQVATVRVDYLHTGNAKGEQYALDRVVIEPIAWAGNMKKVVDSSNRGANLVEVRDKISGELIYSRGFSTVFGEWQSTEEAGRLNRGFQESVRFPKTGKSVNVRILKRDEKNQFQPVWNVDIDTDAPDVIKNCPTPNSNQFLFMSVAPRPTKLTCSSSAMVILKRICKNSKLMRDV
jgi:hypothetical protein